MEVVPAGLFDGVGRWSVQAEEAMTHGWEAEHYLVVQTVSSGNTA